MTQALATTPTSISQNGPRELEIVWADGVTALYDVRDLRLACGCANCVDEWTGEGRLDPGSIPDDVRPIQIERVGRYALQFEWSDGHSTGIYSFDRLRELGRPGGD